MGVFVSYEWSSRYDPLARKAAKSASAQRSVIRLANCCKWAMPLAITATVADACEDAAELLELTKAALVDSVRPKVSYELDAALISGPTVRIGDTVTVTDRPMPLPGGRHAGVHLPRTA